MKDKVTKIKNAGRKFVLCIKSIDWLHIPAQVYVRWILAVILSINSILTFLDVNPIAYSETQIYEVVTVILNVIILFVNTYKNNSTSKEALVSDMIMRSLKSSAEVDDEEAMKKVIRVLEELNGSEHTKNNNTVG